MNNQEKKQGKPSQNRRETGRELVLSEHDKNILKELLLLLETRKKEQTNRQEKKQGKPSRDRREAREAKRRF